MVRKLLAVYGGLFVFLALTAAIGRIVGTPLVLLLQALGVTGPLWLITALAVATYAVAAAVGGKAALSVLRWGWGESVAPSVDARE